MTPEHVYILMGISSRDGKINNAGEKDAMNKGTKSLIAEHAQKAVFNRTRHVVFWDRKDGEDL